MSTQASLAPVRAGVRPLSDLPPAAVEEISTSLRALLADVYTLHLKVKGFHWHIYGPHFRTYHELLDDHASALFAMTDVIAERARKLGGNTLRSIADVARYSRIRDQEKSGLSAEEMLAELLDDNRELAAHLRVTHEIASGHGDFATTSLTENWIDETEQRAWFLHATLQ